MSLRIHHIRFIIGLSLFCCLVSSCGSTSNSTPMTRNISGIVKIRKDKDSIIKYTHKYQKSTIKALPMIITTGIKKRSNHNFTEIDFRSYYKNTPINYDGIVLDNSGGHKWQWEVAKRKKRYINKRTYNVETYSVRIDEKANDLIRFLRDQPISIKFIGQKETSKQLAPKHVRSMMKVLMYSIELR